MSSPREVIASALGTWYGDPDEWFWTHAGEIVDALALKSAKREEARRES